jgi:predicted aminopeptidase
VLGKYFDDEHDAFVKAAAIVHRKTVFQILTRIIKLCNVDTGRLRASFTPIMDRYGWKGFEPYMQAPPIEGGKKLHPKGYSEEAVSAGKIQGQFIDAVLNTTISSNVVYASDVDWHSQFLTKALVWGDTQYNKNFQNFFEAAAKKGWIPEQDPNAQDEE